MPPPPWALAERALLRINAEGVRAYADRLVDARGYLPVREQWGVSNGPDDLMENIRNWPLAHALGGAQQIAEGAWSYGSLHDARNVTWVPTLDEIRTIVAFVDNNSRTLGPRGPVAFVAASRAVPDIARMYSQIGAGSAHHAEIFQDIEAARQWLDRDAATRR